MAMIIRGPTILAFMATSIAAPAMASSPHPIIVMRDEAAVNASVRTYPFPGCNGDTKLGDSSWTMAPDTCLKVSTSTTFRILEPAICPNGTRAKLARYEGRDCNYGEVTLPGGLAEVTDDNLNKCQNVWIEGHASNATHASIASFGFFCDGRKGDRPDEDEEESRERWGSVSMNTCPVGRDPPRAPTFSHPLPGACSAILTSERLEIFFPATCSDGSQSKLATWYGTRMCEGDYHEIRDIDEDLMDECFFVNRNNHSSFAFWCPDSGSSDVKSTTAPRLLGTFSLLAAAWILMV